MTSPVVARILARSVAGTSRVRASLEFASGDGVERPAPGQAPTAFRIWSAGENPTSKGTHTFTARSAELLLAQQAERGNLYSIDVDHMSLSDAAPPEHHRAVGWHRLEVRQTSAGPELWAVGVEWTPEVKAALESQPPGFRYFSPAYDVARESGEVVGYLNTALTNNPATFNVTALATRAGEEEKPMKMQDILAALKAAAEGDDEAEAKKAKAALAALEGGDEHQEPDGDEPKKDSEPEEPKKDTGGDPEDESKKDSVAASLDAEAIEKIVDAKLQAIADNAERDRLLASRKDVGEKVLCALKSKPLSLVREMLDAIPVAAKKNPAADATVQATRGATQGKPAASEHAANLDERMGLSRRRATVRADGTDLVFEAMTPDDAKAFIAAKNGGQ